MMNRVECAPGFRRRFRITPTPGHVVSEVEDDYHRMQVAIDHDEVVANSVRADLIRAPWTTCPGAARVCESIFTGVALQDFPGRRTDRAANCTHLYDLALLAAAHALDAAPLVYDIAVSDPVDGRRQAQIKRNGATLLVWSDSNFQVVEPASLAGMPITDLRPWLDRLEPQQREPARLLSWASVIAHGRAIPLEQQSDASRMPASCYTFQPEMAARARRVGEIRDFSAGTLLPLADSEEVQ
jgi:hypothetical protein